MRTETTRIFADLLSLHGHPQDPVPTPQEGTTMNLFKSFWLLGGLQSIDLRVGEEDEPTFGPTYGNELQSRRLFGTLPEAKPEPRATERQVAHC